MKKILVVLIFTFIGFSLISCDFLLGELNPKDILIKYTVTSSSDTSAIYIEYNDDNGKKVKLENVSLSSPWTKSFKVSSGYFASLKASTPFLANVTAKIDINGEKAAEDSSDALGIVFVTKIVTRN